MNDKVFIDYPCPKCRGEVGHRINCPDGVAFTSKERRQGKEILTDDGRKYHAPGFPDVQRDNRRVR